MYFLYDMFKASVLTATIPAVVFYIISKNTRFEELLEVDKCPLCYGTSVCEDFFNDHFLGINNVIFASVNETNVVIKKLANCNELNTVDLALSLKTFPDITHEIKTLAINHLNISYGSLSNNNIRLCPSVEKFDQLFEPILQANALDFTFLFTLMVNPEPLLQQILPAEKGWPIPVYQGSCGRTIMSNYCGKTLTNYLKEDWHTRSAIARNLLIAANNFTFSHSTFGFYFTDITPDNIAISSEGQPTFIDLENVIIVDKNASFNENIASSWKDVHISEVIECDECFAFSSDDICSHSISDHNVYAMCKEILNPDSYLIDGGLLHSIPNEFLQKNTDFLDLLKGCITPRKGNTRFIYAEELINVLR